MNLYVHLLVHAIILSGVVTITISSLSAAVIEADTTATAMITCSSDDYMSKLSSCTHFRYRDNCMYDGEVVDKNAYTRCYDAVLQYVSTLNATTSIYKAIDMSYNRLFSDRNAGKPSILALLGDYLVSNKHIKEIDITGNNITVADIAVIADIQATRSCLSYDLLSIDTDMDRELLHAISKYSKAKSVNLSIGDSVTTRIKWSKQLVKGTVSSIQGDSIIIQLKGKKTKNSRCYVKLATAIDSSSSGSSDGSSSDNNSSNSGSTFMNGIMEHLKVGGNLSTTSKVSIIVIILSTLMLYYHITAQAKPCVRKATTTHASADAFTTELDIAAVEPLTQMPTASIEMTADEVAKLNRSALLHLPEDQRKARILEQLALMVKEVRPKEFKMIVKVLNEMRCNDLLIVLDSRDALEAIIKQSIRMIKAEIVAEAKHNNNKNIARDDKQCMLM